MKCKTDTGVEEGESQEMSQISSSTYLWQHLLSNFVMLSNQADKKKELTARKIRLRGKRGGREWHKNQMRDEVWAKMKKDKKNVFS